MAAKLTLDFTPKQLLLMQLIENSNHTRIGYGGARGGAKSHAVRHLAYYLGAKYRVPVLLFRKHSKELLRNHINPLFTKFPFLRKNYNKTDKILYSPDGFPILEFGYADTYDDILKFQGGEYGFIFIDEATQIPQEWVEFLLTCMRDSTGSVSAKMIMTMNPGGIGHAYIKRIFIDRYYVDNENADDYAFIQAHVWDNVFWSLPQLQSQGYSIKDYYEHWDDARRKAFTVQFSDYAKNLSVLPDDLREAYLYGDWEVFGGMFFKNFSKKRQVIEPFRIPDEWRLIGSIDPGFASPCSFGLMAQDYEDNVYRILTYYEKERNALQHAAAIRELLDSQTAKKWIGEREPDIIVSGRDAWAKKDRYSIVADERTFSDVFETKDLFLTPAVTDRIPGWWAFKGLIPDHFFIFAGMNNALISEMTAVKSDPKQPEDIEGRGNDKDVLDHALDETRYGIMELTAGEMPEASDEQPDMMEPEVKSVYDLDNDNDDPRRFW